MFEAIVALCLLSDPATCRDVLIPGYEAATLAGCQQQLDQRPPDADQMFSNLSVGPVHCHPEGPAATFTQAAPGVYVHLGLISDAAADNQGDVSNAAFVIGDKAVAMIDASGSRKSAEEFYRAIRQHTDLPISHLILTHMHPDHVLGAELFAQSGAQVVGHASLPRALGDRAETYLTNFGRLIGADFIGTQVHLPNKTVETTGQIDLGGRVLQLQSWPNAHTGNDLTVGDPSSGILFTGDLMFHDHAPALDGSVLGWQKVLSDLQGLPYTRIVPGHGGPVLNWPQDAMPLADYLDILIRDTRAAIETGASLGQAVNTIAQSQSNEWQLFELFNPRNATVAYTELEWE